MTDKTSNESMAEIAARWVARLDRGDLSAEELIELRDWATASPAHMRELERIADVWEGLDALGTLRQLLARPASAPSRSLRRYAIAAGVVAAALLGWMVGASVLGPVEVAETYVTDIGEQRSIEPGEGSRIDLNTDSSMAVDFTAEMRLVRLSQGEAYFDVASDDDRPFVVATPHGDVVVTGTAFLVRVEPSGLEVAVKEGQVQLRNAPGAASGVSPALGQLAAGELATVDVAGSSQVDVIESEQLIRKLGWRDGMLMFNGESLEEVVREVSRYTPVRIVIEDQSLREQRIGGYFKVGEVEDLLGTLQNDFDVDVQRVNDSEVRLTTRSN